MDNNKFISLDDFTRVLDDVVTQINENYVKKEQNIQTKTVFIFKYNDTIPTQLPAYINWDVAQDIVTISVSEGWMLNTDEYAANGRALWMSSGTITSLEPNTITWATPIRLTGERGPAGLDGTILEYKYRLTRNDLSVPTGPAVTPDDWTDTPSGVSATNQAEWVSSRYKETPNSDGTDWSTPVLWAKYGVNGVDGNGYEYIYYRNNGENVPSLGEYDVNSAEYQLDEYLPSGWSDDPQSVSADQRYVWMSSRKKQNQTWSAFKTPVVWAKFGEKGDTGYLIKTMYTKTDGESAPYYVYNNINPGSSWSSQMPSYATGEYVWEIKAYFNSNNEFVNITGSDGHTLYGWGSPILVSGIKGDTGNVPNYKIYVYKFSETQPSKPSTDSPTNVTGWDDYPTDMGNAQGRWWQSIGSVNGNSGLVTNWTDPMPINGIDGQHTEFRFKITTDTITPEIINNVREPEGWVRLNDMVDTTVPVGGSMWQVTAEIDDKNNLIGNWSHPVKISGEKGERGERGPVGERGFTGIPGSNITYRYALGDANSVKTSWQNEVTTLKTTDAYPYIWAQIGRDVYEDKDNNGTYEFARTEWDPNGIFIMSGKPGQNGKGGQLVYPAGQYDPNAVYITTEKIAPYVYYDGEYYVLNDVMTWVGTEQNNKTPNESECWIEFDGFQALHTQVGIIENGLIGSAVFNGDYMFSQWGICNDGTVIDENTSSETLRSCFEKFNPDDPYGENAEFKPNICFNLKTGQVWMNAGKTVFNSDGSGFLADGKISWDFDGEIDVDQLNALGIVAADISASEITGKTIQSSDNSWKIGKDGDGYLANGNISWDAEGHFDAIITGSFDGGVDGNIANGALTWKEDGVHIHENLIFDEGKGISWDTLSGVPDIATKDYVDQNAGGFTTEIGNNWIKTADVTCEKLKVAKLDTAPTSGNDKITISGNTFQVLNDNDNPGVSISNNDISFEYSPERLDKTAVFEMSEGFLNFKKIVTDGNGIHNGDDVTTGAVLSLGAFDYGATIGSLMCAFRLTQGTFISTSKYSLLTSNTAARPYITIYKYNNVTKSWESYKKIGCTSWDKVTLISGNPSSSDTTMYRFGVTNVGGIWERGIYALGLTIPAGGLILNQMITGGGIQGRVDFSLHTINRNLSTFVDIGKNGIVINSENGNIYMDNSTIQLSMGTKNSMYGIKITPSGMYFCKGGTSWRPWEPSSD